MDQICDAPSLILGFLHTPHFFVLQCLSPFSLFSSFQKKIVTSTGEWIHKLGCIHAMENYPAVKKKKKRPIDTFQQCRRSTEASAK